MNRLPFAEEILAARKAQSRSQTWLARQVKAAAAVDGEPNCGVTPSAVSRWESGVVTPQPHTVRWIAHALNVNVSDLSAIADRQRELKALLPPREETNDITTLPFLIAPSRTTYRQAPEKRTLLTVDGVEAVLRRLYRLDAEFGGNELCDIIAGHVQSAAGLLSGPGAKVGTQRRLVRALAELTQVAGWLSIDANRHSDANRYLTATIYAAHEVDHLGLAGHALGYMSLDAFYRDQPKTALALAETALDLARMESSGRTRAVLHNRVARAHARLGDVERCKGELDRAGVEYAAALASSRNDPDPQWIAYVGDIELAAQRGACYLDLGLADEAIATLKEAIRLLHTTAPDHLRDLAHYKIRLASACLLQGEAEEAVAVARQAYRFTTEIGSARVNKRFSELMVRFRACDAPAVRALLDEVSTH